MSKNFYFAITPAKRNVGMMIFFFSKNTNLICKFFTFFKISKFKILYNTYKGNKRISEYIQQQWKVNLNIDVSLTNHEWQSYLAARRALNYDVACASWMGDYQDPNTFLDMFVKGGAMNDLGYENPAYDQLIKKAATIEHSPTRMTVLKKAEDMLITQDAAVIPLFTDTTANMIDRSKWGGWYSNILDVHPVKYVYKK